MQCIECKDLKLHNLKNINVNIPKGQLTVITGVSGSGKSTFAFDILAHVGQAKYLSAIGMLLLLQSLFVEIGEGNTSEIPLEPSMFSQNSAMGLCFNCYGKGFVKDTSQMEREVLQSFLKEKRSIGEALHRLLRAPFKQYCKLIGDKDRYTV